MGLLALLGASSSSSSSAGIGGGLLFFVFFLIYIAVLVAYVAGMWKMFEKAGQKGWYSIIPILNIYVLVKLAGREVYWVVIWLLCCLSIVAAVVVFMDLAPKYGKSRNYGIGMALIPFIFIPLLGFSDAEYTGDKTPVI